MKKYMIIGVLSTLLLFGCTRDPLKHLDVTSITDLDTLQTVIGQVSDAMQVGSITMESAQDILDQLQQKYIDLTDITQADIETQFTNLQTVFEKKALVPRSLPLWAKRLWMVAPQGMHLDTQLSKQISTDEYSSTVLVYTGDYDTAMQQAQRIAQQAHLYVSKDFQKAQALMQLGEIGYISGLDANSLMKWIVYVNYDLFDMAADPLLSVSVDELGVLTIETMKYKK